ncbi:MAG: hypothetical protein Q8O79_05550 [Pseudomonadota bacterium]|nr:hypothetical protein [Pseudomonadota bacterium]
MPHRLSNLLVLVATGLAGIAQPSFAEQPPTEPAVKAAPRGLAPAQLAAIRAIGRNVLAAKKSGADDPADAEQLVQLRASLDRLIAADLNPGNRIPITLLGQENAAQRTAAQTVAKRREAAHSDARALSGQFKQRAEFMVSRAQVDPQADTTSAGFAIGAQRAQLYERWAQKLDEALADDSPSRVGKLAELRDRLQAAKGGLTEAPLRHDSPTLQATPSTSETPIRAVETAEATPQLAPAAVMPGKAVKPRKHKAKIKAKSK